MLRPHKSELYPCSPHFSPKPQHPQISNAKASSRSTKLECLPETSTTKLVYIVSDAVSTFTNPTVQHYGAAAMMRRSSAADTILPASTQTLTHLPRTGEQIFSSILFDSIQAFINVMSVSLLAQSVRTHQVE